MFGDVVIEMIANGDPMYGLAGISRCEAQCWLLLRGGTVWLNRRY